jgi:hypothetical protein
MFNGPTTITGAVTTGTGGLTIDGTGAVTLSAAPTLTTGLTVDNTAGVTIPSVTLPAGQAINATGKVIFGTAANSAAIEGGTLTSAAGGLVTVAADGVISLPFNTTAASLVLDAGGRIAIVGTGKVVIGTTAELKGAGSTWDAGTDDVTFEPTGLAGASIEGGTNATLTPSGANAELYLLAASAAQTLTFSGTTSFTLDLSGVGKITFDSTTAGSLINLAANTNGIKLTSVLAIVGSNTAATAITAGDFVDGGGAYNATTCNVSLIDGVIKHNTINAAAPIAIDKTTVAVDLASNDT